MLGAGNQTHRITLAAAATTCVAIGGTAHPANVQQGRAIGGRAARCGVFQPALLVHLKVHRCQAGEQGEHATDWTQVRSEEHTSELQSLMRISYAVFCLKKK